MEEKMKRTRSKIVIVMATICMLFASSSAVFAATPNEQVIAAVGSAKGASAYAGIASSFLRDTGKVLTQSEANGIIAEINAASAIYNGNLTAAMATQIQGHFEKAVGIAGFTVSSIGRTSGGGFTFTVYDPASGKSINVQGSKVGAPVSSNITGGKVSTNAVAGTTQVAKTGVDNSLYLLVAILACATVAAGVVVYRKKAIQ